MHHIQPREFPARAADLGFALDLPADWPSHALPDETPDFQDPTRLLALAAVTAPHAAIVLAAAARPAYDSGTVSDWTHYLLSQHGITPQTLGEGRLGTLPAIVGQGTTPSELGEMVTRFAFAEDGGRLINLSLTAPALFADVVHAVWQAALSSFSLRAPRGCTVPLVPAVQPVGNYEPLAGGAMVPHALADDAATLDPENPVNARLREQGIGFAPPVLQIDEAARCALVAAGSVKGLLVVPFGWHPIDDGQRLRLLDPTGEVQVSLDLLPRHGRSVAQVLDALEEQVRLDYPAPQCLRMSQGPIEALGVRDIHDGHEALEQFHLLVAGPDEDTLLRARVTAVPARGASAANLGEELLTHWRCATAA